MRKRKHKRWLKIVAVTGPALLLIVLTVPYLFALSEPDSSNRSSPFANGGFDEIDGVAFHRRLYEPSGRPVRGKLLLIHGLAGSTFSFEALAPLAAADGYLTVSVDLPGFGYSDRVIDYDHSRQS